MSAPVPADAASAAALAPQLTEDRSAVHTVDSGPKTGSKGSHIVVIFFIAIVCIFAIILLVLGFQFKDATQSCAQIESATCYTLTCPSSYTTLATCGNGNPAAVLDGVPSACETYAYRYTSTSTLQCGWNPGHDFQIIAADKGICDNYTTSS